MGKDRHLPARREQRRPRQRQRPGDGGQAPLTPPPDWLSYLEPEELEQYQKTEAWIHTPDGIFSKTVGLLGRPIDLAYRAVPGKIKDGVSQALYQVLLQVRDHSRDTVRRQALYDRISQAIGADASQPHNLNRVPLETLDRAARRIGDAHRQLAVVQGGLTGAAGLPGLVADVPSLYFLIFRCVEEIACCYGFPADTEAERDHVLKVVDVAHFLESESKRKGMLELESFDDMLRRGAPVKDLERTVLAKGLQGLSRQLSSRLVQRKLAQTMAVIGALIGASVNAALVSDVATTAYHAYRRRRLRQTALRRADLAGRVSEDPVPPPEATPPDEAPIPGASTSVADGSPDDHRPQG